MKNTENIIETLNNLPGMVYIGSGNLENFTFTYVSGGCSPLLYYKPEEFIANGLSFSDIVHIDDMPEFEKLWESTLAIGLPLDITLRLITKEGSIKHVWFKSLVAQTDSEGAPCVFEGYFSDITNLLQRESAKLVNQERRRIIALMESRFKPSANVILGTAELGLQEELPPKIREYIHKIKEAGLKLTYAFNNLLDYDTMKNNEVIENLRSKEKQLAPLEDPVKVNILITSEFSIDGIDVGKGVKMTGGSFDNYLKVLNAYYDSGRDLLGELNNSIKKGDYDLYGTCAHAIKASSASIGALHISELARELELALERNDAAFIKALNPRFLREFERLLDNIALVILEDEAVKMETGDIEDRWEIKPKQATGSRKKILIIDDAESFLLILNNILKDDYEVLIAIDGEDGLDTARITKPDLILLDAMMPGITGYEVLAILKADADLRDIPVIMISGKESDESKEKGLALGAVDFITKPFDAPRVKNTVDFFAGRNVT